MTQLVSIDFSGTLTTDFNKGSGTYCSYTSGQLHFSGEGLILAKTSLGTDTKWMRFNLTTLANDVANVGFALGDSSGNGFIGLILHDSAGNASTFSDLSPYNTYTTYVGSDEVTGGGFVSWTPASQAIGVTFDPSTNAIRVWFNVTAAEPASTTSWDSRAADVSYTSTFDFGSTHQYAGFGSWSGTPGTNTFDNFTAGDFSAGGGGSTTAQARRRRQRIFGTGPYS